VTFEQHGMLFSWNEQFMFLLVLIAMEKYFSIQTTTYIRDSEIVC
jgi:hypothetical protein